MVRETTGGLTKRTCRDDPQMADESCRQTLDVSADELDSNKSDCCPHDEISFMTRMSLGIDLY